jgi:hypothetical protein
VYETGESYGSGTNVDYATIKYDTDGVQQWVQRYNGPGNYIDYATSITVDRSGNVYVTGESYRSGTNADYATIKYNTDGVQQWVQRYNGLGNSTDCANSIAVDSSGNVYVTGWSYGNGTDEDYATIKYSGTGVQQWVQRYNGPGNSGDVTSSITVDCSGNVYVTGWSIGNGTGADYATVKYNNNGIQQWVQRYNGPVNMDDEARSIAVDDSGNVYVTGGIWEGVTRGDFATIKYNSNGIQQWIQLYNSPGDGDDGAVSLAIDGSGNVYVTGGSSVSGTHGDYATIKYSQLIGINPISSEVPDKYSLYQNYPNPFNPSTKIKFSISLSRGVPAGQGVSAKLIIYDLLGREVATLVNEQLKPGSYEVEWDGSNYPSGVYIYRLTTNSFNESKVMVLIK